MYLQVQVNLAEILSERETISRTVQTALDNESLGSQSRACRDVNILSRYFSTSRLHGRVLFPLVTARPFA